MSHPDFRYRFQHISPPALCSSSPLSPLIPSPVPVFFPLVEISAQENSRTRKSSFDWNDEELDNETNTADGFSKDGNTEIYEPKDEDEKESSDDESTDESSDEPTDEVCMKCKTSKLQEGWIFRCEECFDPEYIRLPCSKCEYRNFCEVCRAECREEE